MHTQLQTHIINKSLSVKHQELMCKNEFTYANDVEKGMVVPLDNNLTTKHEKLLFDTFEKVVERVVQIKWLRINNYEYRNNLLILHNSSLNQIQNILINDNRFYFLCKQFDVVSFIPFLNSFKIEENSIYILVELCNLKHMKSYEIKFIESDKYIAADTLDLRKQLCLPE